MERAPIPDHEVAAQLERVLASTTFRAAERSARLLRFIVSETMQGRGDRLKDYTLGAEGLGRGDGFDPRTDPIARVEASRLRSRLDVYYATEGAADRLRILVPKGGYVPMFEARPEPSAPVPANAARQRGISPTAIERRRRASAWPMVWVAAAAAALAGGATWWLARLGESPSRNAEVRLELTTPPTSDPASLALSPDGRMLAFAARDGDVTRLWVRALGDATARPLPGTDFGVLPFWSPDGRSLGFFAEGRIKSIDLETRLVRTLSTAPVPAGAAWGRGDTLLHPLVPDSPLFRRTVSAGGLEPATRLAPGQTGHRGPTFLPDGRRFLFYAACDPAARGVYLGELGSFRTTRLVDADAPAVFVPPDTLLYVQRSALFARRFDPAGAAVDGATVTVAEDVGIEPIAGVAALGASAGTIAYRRGAVGPRRQFIWFDRRGQALARVGVPDERGPAYGSISPDGRRLAVQRSTDGNTDIWLVDLERGPSVRFTSQPGGDIAPVWSPGGDRIAYAAQVDGVFELFEKSEDAPTPRPLLRTGQPKQVTDWSRDGRYLLYRTVTTTPQPDTDIWALPLEGDRTPFPVVRTAFEERDGQLSPDGSWLAYQSNDSGRHEIYVQPFKRPGERLRISTDGGVQVRWRGDGRELFYLTPHGHLMAVSISADPGGRLLRAGAPVPLFRTRLGAVQGVALPSYLAAPDGQRFLLDTLVDQEPAPIALILGRRRPGT